MILRPSLFLTASLGLACLPPLAASAAEVPPLVRIECFATVDQQQAALRSCSGFVVEKEGFVLTTYRNLTDTASGRLLESFRVALLAEPRRSFQASIIGVEPTLNLGILKLQTDEMLAPAKRVQDGVVAAGLPIAAWNDATDSLIRGVVSGLNTRQCYQESLTSTMFRAKITLPDSAVGGPVFLPESGEVAAIFTGFKPVAEPGHAEVAGETHLLPIHLCFNIYESIKQKRSLKSPWTGFSVRPLTADEQRFFPTVKKHHGGVAIEHVWENSPAQKLGLREGDILVQFAYNRIQSVADFQKWLYMHGVGQPVKLVILRNGTEYLMADYVIEERPEWARPK